MNKNNFKKFKKLYDENEFDVLLKEVDSVYWLKLRSISRKALMIDFCEHIGLDCEGMKSKDLLEYIYNTKPTEKEIDVFIDKKYKEERKERLEKETDLVSELYKMKVLDWGGLYQNSLERTLVNNYIKKIDNFNILNKRIENEIHLSVKGYVQSSWFNHWTSILIEDIFKDHKKVIPTVGLIKKVDFFVSNIPFDLKVTYFPEGYMLAKRKELGLSSELQTLKNFAKKENIKYNNNQKDKVLYSELYTRISERNDDKSKKFMSDFSETRWNIVEATMKNKKDLIKWLYEEQGVARFDASNRLFLILIDKKNMDESWKMKRNIEILNSEVDTYLDGFNPKKIDDLEIEFGWQDGKTYNTHSDALFVIK